MEIKELIIKDVRCFAGEQRFRIRPLTFLIGENSTGKTTALGCFQVLRNFLQGPRPYGDVDFNIDPYKMGTFSDIARKTASKNKESFALGLQLDLKKKKTKLEYLVEFVEGKRGGEPVIRMQKIASVKGDIIFERSEDIREGEEPFAFRFGRVKMKNGKKIFFIKYQLPFIVDAWDILSIFKNILYEQKGIAATEGTPIIKALNLPEKEQESVAQEYKEFVEYLLELSEEDDAIDISPSRSHSFGPTRSKPQRTYDAVTEAVNPEGDDIPMALRRIYRDKEDWKDLETKLVKFGNKSKLFSEISVKEPLGDSMADPFQLRFKVRGPQVNTVDVGYGVSQILPILVRLFVANRPVAFSIHQPEVHLHPRGQAELASLLTELIKKPGHQFMVETHSDHMIDRARIDIMKKRISPEDVSLIYLEHTNNSVKVHNIEFDDMANLENAPGSYREFFLDETDKLLGFD